MTRKSHKKPLARNQFYALYSGKHKKSAFLFWKYTLAHKSIDA